MSIETTLRKYEPQLLQLPHVTGVGIGETDGKQVILVFVDQKLPESTLRPDEIVPKTLDGYKTQVEAAIRVD